jgi:hypothetical protein
MLGLVDLSILAFGKLLDPSPNPSPSLDGQPRWADFLEGVAKKLGAALLILEKKKFTNKYLSFLHDFLKSRPDFGRGGVPGGTF